MTKKRLPSSIRKFIRREKARIRREILDITEQEKKIAELYKKFISNNLPSNQDQNGHN